MHVVGVLAPPHWAVIAMGAEISASYGCDMTSTPRFSRPLLAAAAVLSALALTACGGAQAEDKADTGTTSPSPTTSTSTPSPSATSTDSGLVYVAVGASETVGIGADNPKRDAWPVVLHRTALKKAQLVNLGVSGSTVGQAINEQLPAALAAEPDVATVWLAVNDLTHLVPVQAYEQQLTSLVHQLRRDGRTQVLVGNMPAVERLPAFRACLPDAPADADAVPAAGRPGRRRDPRRRHDVQRGHRPRGEGRGRHPRRPVQGPGPDQAHRRRTASTPAPQDTDSSPRSSRAH